MPMQINGIHHVALVVRDFDKMYKFYTEGLGFEPAFDATWDRDTPDAEKTLGIAGSVGRMVMLKAGNTYFELHQYAEPEDAERLSPGMRPCDQGIRHFCLDVTDIDEAYEHLMSIGMTFPAPPTHFDEFPVNAVYGRDPEGNIIEVQEVKQAPSFSLSDLEKTKPGAFTP